MIRRLLIQLLTYVVLLTSVSESASAASSTAPVTGPVLTWPYQSYVTEPDFHPPVLDISKTGNTTDGLFFFVQILDPFASGGRSLAPMIMTETGDAVWHGPNPLPGPQPQDVELSGNLAVQRLDGENVLSYWTGAFVYNAVAGHGVGVVKILDSTYQEIYTVGIVDSSFVAGHGLDIPGQSYIDVHESLITPQGSMLVTAYNSTPYDLSSFGGPKNGWLNDNWLYEIDIKTNKTLFRWSTLDHIAQIPLNQSMMVENGLPIGGQSASDPWEYFNLNSVTTWDYGYIIGSRFFSSIYALKQDGSIMWHLQGITGGDFTLGPGAQFRYQHNVRVAYNSFRFVVLTMLNNDNSGINGTNGIRPTTGLTLLLDLWNRKATVVRSLLDPKDLVYALSQGNYQPLSNNHTFLGYGASPKWKEFDQHGNSVMTVKFGDAGAYRAFLEPWSSVPHYGPRVNATVNGFNSTIVYMSWNGATPEAYNYWLVYAAGTDGHLALAANVSRTGFETNATIGAAEFVQVAPANGAKVLLSSSVITVAKS